MKQILSRFFSKPSSTNHLEQLLILTQEISSFNGVDSMLNVTLAKLGELFKIHCAVFMVEGDQFLAVRSAYGFPASFKEKFKIPMGEGKIWDSFSSGKAIQISKRELENLDSQIRNEEFLSVPLVAAGQTLALFLYADSRGGRIKNSVKEQIAPYLKILTVGLVNSSNLERVEKFNRRLESEVAATTQELAQTNSRLIHRVRELKTLYELTLTSGKIESLENLFETTTSHLQDLFDVEYGAFFTEANIKEESFELDLQFPSFGLPYEVSSKIKIDSSSYRECASPLKLVVESYRSKEIQVYEGPPISLQEALPWKLSSISGDHFKKIMIRSMVAVPLQMDNRVPGVMILVNFLREGKSSPKNQEVLLQDDEVRTLTLIAFRVASSIEAFQMDREVQNRLVLLSTLQEISELFYTNPVMEIVLDKVMEIVKRVLPCDFCSFLIADFSKEELQLHTSKDQSHLEDAPLKVSLKDESALSVKVFKEAKTKIVSDFHETPLSGDAMEVGEEIHTLMMVPLRFGKDVLGVLKVGSKSRNYFNSYHQRLTEIIAERTAAILQSTRLYEKLVQANKELEKASQIKTEFVSIVSHELRTPVTALKGAVRLVLEGEAGELNPHQTHLLQIASNSTERLIFLISDLLDISRIEAGRIRLHIAVLSLNKVFAETEEIYYSSMKTKRLKFTVSLPDALPLVSADEFRVKQVIDNLLTNAMKFTPAHGEVRLSAENMGDFVQVSVTDTGVGIKPEHQNKIFDKFFQVDSSLSRVAGGTGLGLAISKSIVEMHGGRLWVESQLGKGSVFKFILPKAKEN